jgi:arginyl-tRNA synthetase
VIERYEEHKFDKMLYVISSQQDLHTAQFIKMLHRKGTVVFLEQIIREAASVMHEQMKKNQEKYAVKDPEQTSLEVGLAAIKIQDMAAKRCTTSSLSLSCRTDRTLAGFRINDYTFNWDRMMSFEGDTGPYLTIRVRSTDFPDTREPRTTTASSTRSNRRRDTSRTTRRAGNRFPIGHVPGRRASSATHA